MGENDFAARYGPWAVIAGASEGLGVAFAHRLAAHGINLLLIARKPGPLEGLAADIKRTYGTETVTLTLDLTNPDALERIALASATRKVGMLIYNAGADSRVAEFVGRSMEECERMVALNVVTPTQLVRHFAPAMCTERKGGIILLSSFASAAGTPGNALYASTKAFSNIFAEGLWFELGQHGVDVLGVIIGIARTPAMERMGYSFDGVTTASEPADLVDEALANIDKGPTLTAGGIGPEVARLRSLPRGDAVRSIAAFSNAAQATASQ